MIGALAAMLLSMLPPSPAPACALTAEQASALRTKLGPTKPFVFCAGYAEPIRRVDPLRAEWVAQAGRPQLEATCQPGQFLVFQVGVFARRDIAQVDLAFDPLVGRTGAVRDAARCISLGGIDDHGRRFRKHLSIRAGHLQPLWCGWDIPIDARGSYVSTLRLMTRPGGMIEIPVHLTVAGRAMPDHGADDPALLTRLRWLDSTVGQGDSIVAPFVPIWTEGRTIRVLGRELTLAPTGLPAAITSHFSSANTHIVSAGKPVLSGPFRFEAVEGGRDAALATKLRRLRTTPAGAEWRATGILGGFRAALDGRLDFTGSGEIAVRLTATRDMALDDIRMTIPYAAAPYMMGLNHKGGLRPKSVAWSWDTTRHQDCFWLGDVNAGLMVRLKGSNYRRPLVNIYYKFLPLAMPHSWGNSGAGGVSIRDRGGATIATAYSGKRTVRKGETLEFIADLYLTPFRTIDTEKQWSTRLIHPHPTREPRSLDDALAMADRKRGPNVITVHQAGYYNPYINYPYSPDSFPALTDFIRRAHAKGVRARVYYTTREITQNMPELYALHALNGEVIFPGPGKDARTLINPKGPTPWLVRNLGSDFVPAWVDHVGGKYAKDDISVITTPDSRWNNFYLEGLKWMVDKAGLDGIYIDDTALDAASLRRARRILSVRPKPFIDLHTWNHFNEYAGFANNLNMYMEVLPYLDRLWLGEGFSAKDAPWDYWLVEMSGLPFGLMSEMLDGPDPIRGLVFGETGRLGWSGDPRPMWKLFDAYGMQGTDMHPFFDSNSPIKTGRQDVPATVYQGHDHAIVAIGNWSAHAVSIRLAIDWKKLGLDPVHTELIAPAIEGTQAGLRLEPSLPIDVSTSGIILVLRRAPGAAPKNATKGAPSEASSAVR